MTPLLWTEEDSKKANAQGWGLFECQGSVDGDLQICRLDEPEWNDGLPVFENDSDAWTFVWNQSVEGDMTAIVALAEVARRNPDELVRIKKHLGLDK